MGELPDDVRRLRKKMKRVADGTKILPAEYDTAPIREAIGNGHDDDDDLFRSIFDTTSDRAQLGTAPNLEAITEIMDYATRHRHTCTSEAARKCAVYYPLLKLTNEASNCGRWLNWNNVTTGF